MKNYLLFIVLLIFIFPKDLFSQDQKRSNFQVHKNYTNVKGKLREKSNSSIGIGVEYHFPIIKSIGLDGLGGIGYERLLNCTLCLSEWYVNGYGAVIGLSKRFKITDKHKLLAQFRHRRVGFEHTVPVLFESDGTILRWEKIRRTEQLLGFRLGYFLPLKMPMVLSYTYESGHYYRLNTISLGYHF